jgi:hypothetical protein
MAVPRLGVTFQTPPTTGKTVAFGVNPQESRALPENGAPREVFSNFLRYTTPTPPPSKGRFYWEELKANFRISMQLGQARYRDNLINDRYARIKATVLTLAFGVGYAMFRRLRRTFSYLFMLGMLAGPIKEANRTLPELQEAYEQVKRGNPSVGRQMFQLALDDSVYSIMHDFMKPLTFGMGLGILLSVPSVIRGEGKGFLNRLLRLSARGVGLKPETAVIRWLDRIMQPLIARGDLMSNRLRRALPFLKFLEMP